MSKAVFLSLVADSLDQSKKIMVGNIGPLRPTKDDMEAIQQFNDAIFAAYNIAVDKIGVDGCMRVNCYIHMAADWLVHKTMGALE